MTFAESVKFTESFWQTFSKCETHLAKFEFSYSLPILSYFENGHIFAEEAVSFWRNVRVWSGVKCANLVELDCEESNLQTSASVQP